MKPPATASNSRLVQSLATASGALAATVATSQAATVQITLTNNKLSSTTNTLNADVTGDGTSDFAISGVFQTSSVEGNVGFNINGQGVNAGYFPSASDFFAVARVVAGGVGVASDSQFRQLLNLRYLNPLTFTDVRINGGAATQGYLEVNAFNSSSNNHTVALTRLVFDNASTTLGTIGLSTSATYSTWTAVPEPSSFGLLALGAGGLLVRRRRDAA